MLRALADLGDPRALPMVRWALEHPDIPNGIESLASTFAADLADLVPLLRQRLRCLPAADRRDHRRDTLLVVVLGRIGPPAAAALPVFERYLDGDQHGVSSAAQGLAVQAS